MDSDVKVENALLDMHGKCGDLELACYVFETMAERDVISWNAMAEAYIHQGRNEEAFGLFKQMQEECVLPDEVSCITLLSACVNEGSLVGGKRLHCLLSGGKAESDVISGTALVNMYAKCGHLYRAELAFGRMLQKNVVSWNAMVAAYAQHGSCEVCFHLFQDMLSKGVRATDLTYFSILSACSHAGLLCEGCFWFKFMVSFHGFEPTTEHFNCLLDLLGRSGQLDNGEALLYSMSSCQPNAASWATLLASCKAHSDVDRGIRIIRHVIRTDPESAAPYVSISNIYATLGRWEEAEKIQARRKIVKKQCPRVNEYEYIYDEDEDEDDDNDFFFARIHESADKRNWKPFTL
jgi:pentatricopeptide repeat protein